MEDATPETRALRSDLVAGLGTALFSIPQAMAFAMIAGQGPDAGLRVGFAAGVVAALAGSSRLTITHTNNAVCAVVGSIVLAHPGLDPAAVALVLAAWVACYELAFGLLRIGNLTQFISHSVLQGFVVGAALLIVLMQVPAVLGVEAQRHWCALVGVASALGRAADLDPWTLGVAALAAALIVGPARWSDRLPLPAFALVACTVLAWAFDLEGRGVAMVGELPRRLYAPVLPPDPLAAALDLAGPALAVALLAAIQAVAVGKAVALRRDEDFDPNREMVGQGMANAVGAAVGGVPVSISFGGSFANLRGGARTRRSAVLVAVLMGLALAVGGQAARHVPVAALSGIVIGIALTIPDWERVRACLRATRSDGVVLAATFLASLVLPLDRAIFAGVGLSLALFLRKARSPYLAELRPDAQGDFREVRSPAPGTASPVVLLHLEGDLFFAAADTLYEEVWRICRDPRVRVLVLRTKSARNLDATGALALMHLARRLRADGRHMIVAGATPEVLGILRRSGAAEAIGPENVFPAGENVLRATRDALTRAQALAGVQAEPQVYFDHRPSGPS
ncbi:MAG: SulP family inorganic anion transporter [Planctomycetes bacterium]|nr:SulP family inorganic anion transporter [Planctomycetota bacterium]